MHYEIYIDIIFVQAAIISFCSFVVAAAIRGVKLKWVRVVFGSFIGGILGCIILVSGIILHSVSALIGLLVVVLLISAIAFEPVSSCNYRKNCFAVLISLLLLGGISTFLENRLHIMKNILLFTIVFLAGTSLFSFLIRKVKVKQKLFYPVTIYFNGETKSVRALADSGNRIKDAQGKPVCVVSQDLFPDDFGIETEYLIRSLGANEQQMKGGMLEKMVVHTREGNLEYENVPVAIYSGMVSATGKFEMILQNNYCIRE